MPIPIPDKEDIRDMRDVILHICKEKRIPVLKTRCAKEGVWFYIPSSPHKGLWMYHFAYEYFLAQGILGINVSLMLRH